MIWNLSLSSLAQRISISFPTISIHSFLHSVWPLLGGLFFLPVNSFQLSPVLSLFPQSYLIWSICSWWCRAFRFFGLEQVRDVSNKWNCYYFYFHLNWICSEPTRSVSHTRHPQQKEPKFPSHAHTWKRKGTMIIDVTLTAKSLKISLSRRFENGAPPHERLRSPFNPDVPSWVIAFFSQMINFWPGDLYTIPSIMFIPESYTNHPDIGEMRSDRGLQARSGESVVSICSKLYPNFVTFNERLNDRVSLFWIESLFLHDVWLLRESVCVHNWYSSEWNSTRHNCPFEEVF